MNRNQLLQEVTQAVSLRESDNLAASKKLFITLTKRVSALARSPKTEDRNLYIKVIGEYVIQLRHEGAKAFQEALKLARSLYTYNRDYSLNNPFAIRGVSNTLMNLEGYEMAEKYLREILNLIPASDSAKKGDTLAHLSRCLFRQGKVDPASGLIDEAITLIDQNTENAPEMNLAVWKSHALMVKALLLNSRGDKTNAISLVKEAGVLSGKFNLVIRINQSRELLDYLQKQ